MRDYEVNTAVLFHTGFSDGAVSYTHLYAYANSLQRTVATAQFFITGAFPGCDIPVHHQEKTVSYTHLPVPRRTGNIPL